MKNMKLEEIRQKIISDDEYTKWMKEISKVQIDFAHSSDFNNKIALDHGLQHMNRVAEIVYRLMQEYGCDENSCCLGYIAGLIHDIGMIHGKKNHAQNGSDMAKLFLEKLDFLTEDEIAEIVNAIAIHGNGENAKSSIGLFLALADKIDMCNERSLSKTSPIQMIKKYNVSIHYGVLEINYDITSSEGIEVFYILPKTIDIPKKVSTELGLEIKFFINGKQENFDDRKNYQGEIYIRSE